MQFLKTGSIIQGKKDSYKILQTLNVTEVRGYYLCQSRTGGNARLLHYQEGCPIMGKPYQAFLSLPVLPGVMKPTDVCSDALQHIDVFPDLGEDVISHQIGSDELVKYVIPQLNTGLAGLHKNGLLVRDFNPESIFFDYPSRKAFISEYCNLALIEGGATATKTPARNISPLFYPPEYQKMGWSIYSEYYAFGIALFLIVKSQNAFGAMSQNAVIQKLHSWSLPGYEKKQLTDYPYEILSLDQKIIYLIYGLINPDPYQRWGYSEVRCWCTGYGIPWVQSGYRVRYDMTRPITINQVSCWDYDQVGTQLLMGGKKSEGLLEQVAKHISAQNKRVGEKVWSIVRRTNLSAQGKVFYIGYYLAPKTTGFWWNGENLPSTDAIIRRSSQENNQWKMISQILLDCCFSFLLKLRESLTKKAQKGKDTFRQFEAWEQEKAGKGASRFVMKMGNARNCGFAVDGVFYGSLEAFLRKYEKQAEPLIQKSKMILNDQAFESWLWAKGYDGILNTPAGAAESDMDCFYRLLLVCEKAGNEQEKRLCRRIWLHNGRSAHVTWLHENMRLYQIMSSRQPEYINRIKSPMWDEKSPLYEISKVSYDMEQSYQSFVRDTVTNPIRIQCALPLEDTKLIAPKDANAFFVCTRDQIEVTPAFLKERNEKPSESVISQWCADSLADADRWLDEEIRKINDCPAYKASGNKNSPEGSIIAAMVGWIICLGILYGLNRGYYPYSMFPNASLIYLLAGLAFPAAALMWCYTHKMVLNQNDAVYHLLEARKQELIRRKNEAKDCSAQIIANLKNGKGYSFSPGSALTRLGSEYNVNQQENSMTTPWCQASYVLSNIAVLLLFFNSQYVGEITMAVMVVYVGGLAVYLCRVHKLTYPYIITMSLFSIGTAFLIYSIFHKYFPVGAGIVLYLARNWLSSLKNP